MDHLGDGAELNPRHARDIPDIIEESEKGQETGRGISPPRDLALGNRSSSGR